MVTNKLKQIFKLFLTIMMIFTLLPGLEIPVFAEEADFTLIFMKVDNDWNLYEYDPTGNPIAVYTGNVGNWSVDGDTLTLTNFNFSTSAGTAMQIESSAKIVLSDGSTNNITSTSTGKDYSVGLKINSPLIIEGESAKTGVLNITAGSSNLESKGIVSDGSSLTINSGTVNAIGGNSNISIGVYFFGTLSVTGGKLTAKVGNGTNQQKAINSNSAISNVIAMGSTDVLGGNLNKADWSSLTYKVSGSIAKYVEITPAYSITGKITDGDTSAVVSGASVQLKNSSGNVGSAVTTDSNGNYTISNVVNGTYTIEVTATGYIKGTIDSFSVSDANVTNNDKQLIKQPIDATRTTPLNLVDDSTITYAGGNGSGNPKTSNITDSSEGWKWYLTAADGYEANTLVLNNANITVSVNQTKVFAVYVPANTTIVLIGTNNIAYTANRSVNVEGALLADGALMIKGNGSLKVESATVSGIFVGDASSRADLTIESGTITVNSGNQTGALSVGVFANKLIMNGGKLTATSGDSSNSLSNGVRLLDTLVMTGGEIIAQSGTANTSNTDTNNANKNNAAIYIETAPTNVIAKDAAGNILTFNNTNNYKGYNNFTATSPYKLTDLSQYVKVTAIPVPKIAISTTGLINLKVGQAVSNASIVYTLSNDTYVTIINTSDFTVSGLPAGLIAGTPVRTSDTVVTIPITGTPTTANSSTATLTYNTSIPATNMTDNKAITPSGTISTSAIAKADGAAVSGAPSVSGTATSSSIIVNAVTNTGGSGQTVEYAISTSSSPVPTSGWQDGVSFTSLNAGTTYYVFARTKANTNYDAGTAQVSTGITTSSPTPTPTPMPTPTPTTPTNQPVESSKHAYVDMSGANNGLKNVPYLSTNFGESTNYTYYYNTSDKNWDGTLWTSKTVLKPGTYYIYAYVEELGNTTGTTKFVVSNDKYVVPNTGIKK